MELYRKYRPGTFKELIGNKDTKDSLIAKIEKGELPHALLLTGASGCGKTTLGRIIANEINAKGLDYHEIDSADFRGIDHIRSIRRKMHYGATDGDNVVWLLDEAHQIGVGSSSKNAAQSALLKALEDPPDFCYFILCTTDPQMLMKTIRSRCTHYELETLNDKQISILLQRISKREKVKLPKDIIKSITKACNGKPRRALTILEKVIHLKPEQMKMQVQKEDEKESSAFELAQLLFKGGNWQKGIPVLKSLKNESTESIRRVICGYMVSVISKRANERAHFLLWCFKDPLYDDMHKLWYLCHGILNDYDI